MNQLPIRTLTLLASALLIGCQSPSPTTTPFGVALTQRPAPDAALPEALTGGQPMPAGSYVPNELIVQLAPGADRRSSLEGFALKAEWHLATPFAVVRLPDGVSLSEAHARLSARPGIVGVSLNPVLKGGDATPPAPARFKEQWAHRVTEATTLWQQSPPAATSDVIVAVVDSGVDMTHPAFTGRIVAPQNFTAENEGVHEDPTDWNHHGTHVAGIIGANSDQIVGVAPQVALMPIKALNADGRGDLTAITNGIAYAADIPVTEYDEQQNPIPRKSYRDYLAPGDTRQVDVINLSLGSPMHGRHALYDAIITMAHEKGILVVVAAGNEGSEVASPANSPASLAVSSTSSYRLGDQLWEWLSGFSNRGNRIDLSAPGGEILSTLPTYDYYAGKPELQAKNYGYLSGTSMAAPYVAGVAALVVDKYPRQVGDSAVDYMAKVRQHLLATTDDLGAPGKDPKFGWGRINVRKALTAGTFPAVLP